MEDDYRIPVLPNVHVVVSSLCSHCGKDRIERSHRVISTLGEVEHESPNKSVVGDVVRVEFSPKRTLGVCEKTL